MSSPEDEAIMSVIDSIWGQYDTDGNGYLDKKETMQLIKDTLGNVGGEEFDDESFEEVFSTFDKDKSGTIDKAEMAVFIQSLLGGD